MNFLKLFFIYSASLILTLTCGTLCAQTNLSNNYVVSIDPSDLSGTWYVVVSNSRKWKKSNISQPVITYATSGNIISKDIKFLKNKRAKTISSINSKSSPSCFIEKRKHHIFHRRWYVVAMDADKQWIVIYYSKSFLKKEQVHVLSRSPALTEKSKEQFAKLCKENYFLSAKTKRIAFISSK